MWVRCGRCISREDRLDRKECENVETHIDCNNTISKAKGYSPSELYCHHQLAQRVQWDAWRGIGFNLGKP